MRDFVLMTDSSCDLPAKMAEELELVVLPLSVTIGGETYKNYLDERDITFKGFFNRLRKGETAVTSAVNMEAFKDVMRPILAEGKDILYLGFSSGLSATVQSGIMAAQELQEEFPERKIVCYDTLCASLGQGLLVYLAGLEKKKGKSLEEVYEFAKKTAPSVCHWFTVENLFYLKRGGRVSAATAVLGSLLQIKPVLHVDYEGHLISMEKSRGRRASLKRLFEKVRDGSYDIKNNPVFISHGDCEEDVRYIVDLLKEAGVKEIVTNPLGPVIGSHTGPGLVAIFFLGPRR